MALRLPNWNRRLLGLSAGLLLCASAGCKNTPEVHSVGQHSSKPMGPGNIAATPPTSPAFNNLANNAPGFINNSPSATTTVVTTPTNPTVVTGPTTTTTAIVNPQGSRGLPSMPPPPLQQPQTYQPAPQQIVYGPNGQPMVPTNYGQPINQVQPNTYVPQNMPAQQQVIAQQGTTTYTQQGAPMYTQQGGPQQGTPMYIQQGGPQQGAPIYNPQGGPQQSAPTYIQQGGPQQGAPIYNPQGGPMQTAPVYNPQGMQIQPQSYQGQPQPPVMPMQPLSSNSMQGVKVPDLLPASVKAPSESKNGAALMPVSATVPANPSLDTKGPSARSVTQQQLLRTVDPLVSPTPEDVIAAPVTTFNSDSYSTPKK
ncbi:MAG: hypothetical protein K8T89_08255 [Planctomycetes bacterium]|nr:hypothetical protein [Planctomycetota bacterium]